jgi:hypothetical protein
MSESKRKIFISYRRDDNADFVERLRDWFIQRYKRENVFMDFDTIPPFTRFADFINERVHECDVLIAVVGPRWMELMREKAAHFQDDYVRIEVGLALQEGKLVAPICIKGASIPLQAELPYDLRSMLDYNAAFLNSGSAFLDNIEYIIDAIEEELTRRETKSSIIEEKYTSSNSQVSLQVRPHLDPVYIAYRSNTSKKLAQAVYLDLRQHGYDVLLDENLSDTDTLSAVKVSQIAYRVHFIVLLSPGTLEKCVYPDDILRREMEEAMRQSRNIVPVMEERFDFEKEIEYLPEAWREDFKRLKGMRLFHDFLRKEWTSCEPIFLFTGIMEHHFQGCLGKMMRRMENLKKTVSNSKLKSDTSTI